MEPAVSESIGQKLVEGLAQDGWVAAGRGAKVGGGVASGSEIEVNGLTGLPVGRDLEDCGTTESAMGEKHFFAEGLVVSGGDDFGGDAGKFGVTMVVLAVEHHGNQGRAGANDVVAKLAGKVVAEGSGTDFGNGQAAGGDDEDGRAKFGGVGMQDELGGALDFGDARVEEDLDFGGVTFGLEKRGDIGGGTIAEKLAEGFFVTRDVVLFDECEEISGGVAGQRGFGEVRISGMKIFRSGVEIGEIAAASPGDEDFFADAVGVFDERDAASTFGGFESAEESGGASAQDQDVEGTGQSGLTRKVVGASVGQMKAGKKRRGPGDHHCKSQAKSLCYRLVERGGELGVAEVVEHEGDLGWSDADEGKRGKICFGEEGGVGGFVAVLRAASGDFGEEEKFVGVEGERWMTVKIAVVDSSKFGDADVVARFFANFAGGGDGRRLTDIGPATGESPAAIFEFADEEDFSVLESSDARIDFGSGVAGLLGEKIFEGFGVGTV